jgi:hypothetical protein
MFMYDYKSVQGYYPHPPLNKPAKIKLEFTGQEGSEPTVDMLVKQLQGSGCTIVEAWRLGAHGRCEYPKNPSKLAPKLVRYFHATYVGTVQQITQDFLRLMDDEGNIRLPNGNFRIAPLPPTGEFLVRLIVSAGESDSLSGNVGAMTEVGLSHLEIELCLGRIVGKALEQAGTPADLLDKYNGVLISSEVRKVKKSGGQSLYMHPRDPLAKPRAGIESVMTAPAALGVSEQKFGSPQLFIVLASAPTAHHVRTEITEIHLQLPIGKGVSMTPAPEDALIEFGPAAALLKLQQQVHAITAEPLTWLQELHKNLAALSTKHWNTFVNHRLIAEMEAGRGLIVTAHPAVGSQLLAIFNQFDKERTHAREEQEWKILWQNIGNSLQVTEGHVRVIKMEVVQATIWLKNV